VVYWVFVVWVVGVDVCFGDGLFDIVELDVVVID